MPGDVDREIHWPQTLLITVVRLTLFLVFWFNAVWVVDDYRADALDFTAQNMRLAMWLYLIEFLIELYLSPVKMAAARPVPVFTTELLRLAGITVFLTLLNLAARWGLVLVVTWLLERVPTPFWWLPYAAAVLPTVLYSFLKKYALEHGSGEPQAGDVVRGAAVLDYAVAQERVAALRRAAA